MEMKSVSEARCDGCRTESKTVELEKGLDLRKTILICDTAHVICQNTQEVKGRIGNTVARRVPLPRLLLTLKSSTLHNKPFNTNTLESRSRIQTDWSEPYRHQATFPPTIISVPQ